MILPYYTCINVLPYSSTTRHFKLYLRTNTELFTEDFKAVVIDSDGQEHGYEVNRQNYFTGHVIGKDLCHSEGSSNHVEQGGAVRRTTSCS